MLSYQKPLPAPYATATPEELVSMIESAKKTFGKNAIILAHHYQRPEIVAISDYRGDSLKLAQFAASQTEARYIFYCGVHFMAESADILKTGDQTVILPDLGAGCDMADMADTDDVETAWSEASGILGGEERLLPITYINSTAALKAFVGKKGGIICTSTNAAKIIQWGIDQNKVMFFYPDEHLGRNTSKKLGIPLHEMHLWDPKKSLGGMDAENLKKMKVLLWKGHCPVHKMFTALQIDKLREKDPEFKIIVHPECPMEVVDKADCDGSTEFIVSTIANSPAGSKWAVGTELNLVNRIAKENPDKQVVSLNPFMCLCGTMNRIDLAHLAWSMQNVLENHPQNVIEVHEPDRTLAKIALERMLAMS